MSTQPGDAQNSNEALRDTLALAGDAVAYLNGLGTKAAGNMARAILRLCQIAVEGPLAALTRPAQAESGEAAAPQGVEDGKDAARYRWMRDWFLREGKRMEIDPAGHVRRNAPEGIDAAIDAAMHTAAEQITAQGQDVAAIRRAVADYMQSEGCSCCRNSDAHEVNARRLAELLGVPEHPEQADWHDFSPYRSDAMHTGAEPQDCCCGNSALPGNHGLLACMTGAAFKEAKWTPSS